MCSSNGIPCEEVSSAACNVDQWSFLAEGEPRPHSEHHANGLDQQCPCTQVGTNDETTQNGLHLQMVQTARTYTNFKVHWDCCMHNLKVYPLRITKNILTIRTHTHTHTLTLSDY